MEKKERVIILLFSLCPYYECLLVLSSGDWAMVQWFVNNKCTAPEINQFPLQPLLMSATRLVADVPQSQTKGSPANTSHALRRGYFGFERPFGACLIWKLVALLTNFRTKTTAIVLFLYGKLRPPLHFTVGARATKQLSTDLGAPLD